jgi:hypothetical protein
MGALKGELDVLLKEFRHAPNRWFHISMQV